MKYKVKADIGDGEGGGFYHIASFNTIALALVFISGLTPMFGYSMDIMRNTLGTPKEYEDEFSQFKGLKLTKVALKIKPGRWEEEEYDKEIETYY